MKHNWKGWDVEIFAMFLDWKSVEAISRFNLANAWLKYARSETDD